MDAENIRDNAHDVIANMGKRGMNANWETIAKKMGYKLNKLSSEELYILEEEINRAFQDCLDICL